MKEPFFFTEEEEGAAVTAIAAAQRARPEHLTALRAKPSLPKARGPWPALGQACQRPWLARGQAWQRSHAALGLEEAKRGRDLSRPLACPS